MVTILDLIDALIAEHKSGNAKTASLQKAANYALILESMDSARVCFGPGRLNPELELANLKTLIKSIIIFLDHHFQHEETLMLQAVEEYCDQETVNAFTLLLREHDYLKTRISRVLELIQELNSGKLTNQHWNSSANDLKAYLSHTRKLLEEHSDRETKLFLTLREHLCDVTPKQTRGLVV